MKFEKKLKLSDSICIELVGDVELDLGVSDDGWQGVQVQSSVSNEDLLVDVTAGVIRIHDIDKKRRQEKTVEEFVGGLDRSHGLAGLILSGVASIQKVVADKELSRRIVSVKVGLPSKLNELKINADNLHLTTTAVCSAKIRLKCANLKMRTGGVIDSPDVRIRGSNVKASCHFGRIGGKFQVEANNGKIRVLRTRGVRGLIVCSGNNVKVEGDFGGEREFGVMEIECNNGKVSVAEGSDEALFS